jgi:hypothetical protein
MARLADSAHRARSAPLTHKARVVDILDRIRPLTRKLASAVLLISIWLMSVGSAVYLLQRGAATVWASLGGLAVGVLPLSVLELVLPWRTDWIPSLRELGHDALHLGFIQGVIRSVTRLVLVAGFTGVVAFMATLNLTARSLIRVQPFATLIASVAATTMSMLHHANVRFDLRWLAFLIVPPELHRGHHSTILEDERSNYALVFSLWDRWLGTLGCPTRATWVPPSLCHDCAASSTTWCSRGSHSDPSGRCLTADHE